MNFSFFPYYLQPIGKDAKEARQGALLRVRFSNGAIGYADCHPWTEFGALSLGAQLHLLFEGMTTPLMDRSLHFAKIDAEARAAGRHLFHHLEVPVSHYLITDFTVENLEKGIASGHRHFKIKTGRNKKQESSVFRDCLDLLKKANCRLRLDFNQLISEEEFRSFLHDERKICELVEFFEDPFPYDPDRWQKIHHECGISLACDIEVDKALVYPSSCQVLVIKPAIQEIAPFLTSQRENRSIVVTSCLDHPIGQLSAAYVAATAAKEHPGAIGMCGLLSHEVYEPTPFSERLEDHQGRLTPWMQGHGWGYDDLLELLAWQSYA